MSYTGYTVRCFNGNNEQIAEFPCSPNELGRLTDELIASGKYARLGVLHGVSHVATIPCD